MRKDKNQQIIPVVTLGICVHILLLVAVFDTYFKSPLEHGMIPVKSTNNGVSKRVVLLVADGLRASAILEHEERAPFLSSVMKGRGSWGISHTRVPTESRPGHVAILAGIYEDPSALFKGWKHNPVDFDSVINQSTNAWCIGSPDIIPIFNKDRRKHVHTYSYNAEMQDFGNKNTIMLDKWVFNKTKWVLNHFRGSELFKGTGNVFFLHLLGLDTAGHAFKPYSKEYIDNIKYVDRNIQELEIIFKNIFPDERTSFIFTSDHGMTDWGSHGSGLDDETLTPIIAWGAGISVSKSPKNISQIDITPLISSLIGLNYPTNNLGKLPIDYLNLSSGTNVLTVFLNNVLQIYKIFKEKQSRIEKSTFYYKPYKYLTDQNFEKNFTELWHSNEDFERNIERSKVLFDDILKAIDYYHNYFKDCILFSVSLGLFVWLLYLSTYLFELVEIEANKKTFSHVKLLTVCYNLIVIIICNLQSFPLLYYLYFIFPSSMFYILISKLPKLSYMFSSKLISLFKVCYLLFFVLCLALFILGFQYRFCFFFMMFCVPFSPFINPGFYMRIGDLDIQLWFIFGFFLSVFPLFPLMFTEFHSFYFTLGFVFWLSFAHLITRGEVCHKLLRIELTSLQRKIFYFQKIIFVISFLNTLVITSEYLGNFSMLLKYISWFLFLSPLCLIPFSMKVPEIRIITIALSFAPFYIMTSMSYEMIFLSAYSIFLAFWTHIEGISRGVRELKHFENFRKCLIFVSLILIGFFGTGNIASLNSFDPMWVRCFLTVFSPFKMTILIFIKLMVPFLFVGCVFRNLVMKTKMELLSSFCVVLLISDVMVFYFMYNIKNVGSWLDIGMSLSHFVVVECLTLGILVLYFVAYVFMNVDYRTFFDKKWNVNGKSRREKLMYY